MYRVLSLSALALAAALFAGAPVWAQQNNPASGNQNRNQNQTNPAQPGTAGQAGQAGQAGRTGQAGQVGQNQGQMEGKFVKAEGDNRFVMTDRQGGNPHTHTLAANATIMCDGKQCRLSDLKDGTHIRVTTEANNRDVVTRIDANTRDSERNQNQNRDQNQNRNQNQNRDQNQNK